MWQICCEKKRLIYSCLDLRSEKGIYVHDAGHDNDDAGGLNSQPPPYGQAQKVKKVK